MVNLTGLITSNLSYKASIIIGAINIVFILISVLIGISIVLRLRDRLKYAVVFLIVAMAIVLASEILIFAGIAATSYIIGIMRVFTILFILITTLCIKSVINKIDGKYK